MVGSTVTTGSAATAATVSPRVATASVGAGAAAADAATAIDSVAGDAATGDAEAGAGDGDAAVDVAADAACGASRPLISSSSVYSFSSGPQKGTLTPFSATMAPSCRAKAP